MLKRTVFVLFAFCVTMVLSRAGIELHGSSHPEPESHAEPGKKYGSHSLSGVSYPEPEPEPFSNSGAGRGGRYDNDRSSGRGRDSHGHAPGAYDNDRHGSHSSEYDNDRRRGGYDNDNHRKGYGDHDRHSPGAYDNDNHRRGGHDNDNHRHSRGYDNDSQRRYDNNDRHAPGAYDNDDHRRSGGYGGDRRPGVFDNDNHQAQKSRDGGKHRQSHERSEVIRGSGGSYGGSSYGQGRQETAKAPNEDQRRFSYVYRCVPYLTDPQGSLYFCSLRDIEKYPFLIPSSGLVGSNMVKPQLGR